ncbi:MAG: GTP cyclohydrolase FolE2 [Vibrio sp.]
MNHNLNLPDVINTDKAAIPANLQWVGMANVSLPLFLRHQNEAFVPVTASANVYVSLDMPDEKGIHMSRLYQLLQQQIAQQVLTIELLERLLLQMVSSQEGISDNARLELVFDLSIQKSALLSGNAGYQTYSLALNIALQEEQWHTEAVLHIPYSSTCPCSASLSRQLMAEAIDNNFDTHVIDKAALLTWVASQQGSIATPHSQRSFAEIHLFWERLHCPDFSDLIIYFEQAVGTAVQTVVKREDEQEFARLNAHNLMFCEDAARKVNHAASAMHELSDYWYKVEHQESLHAHNAIAIGRKSMSQ